MSCVVMDTGLPKKIGHYELRRVLAVGGTSKVYKAIDTRTGQPAAVKVLNLLTAESPARRKALLARMKREARAVLRLSHPNIVRVLEMGEGDGEHYVAMEYLLGCTLQARLDLRALSPVEAARILDQAASALEAIHAQGVIHRDLKPSNIMLLPGGQIKLMDFGIARQIDDTQITQADMIVGSPAFMAPELIQGEPETRDSDLWALGILLYAMLAGRPPFSGESIPALMYQVIHKRPPPLARVPARAEKVVMRALEKDPARRYRSARALADAFRAAVEASAESRPAEARAAASPPDGIAGRAAELPGQGATPSPCAPPAGTAGGWKRRASLLAGALALLAILVILGTLLAGAPARPRGPAGAGVTRAASAGQAGESRDPLLTARAPAKARPPQTARRVRSAHPAPRRHRRRHSRVD